MVLQSLIKKDLGLRESLFSAFKLNEIKVEWEDLSKTRNMSSSIQWSFDLYIDEAVHRELNNQWA